MGFSRYDLQPQQLSHAAIVEDMIHIFNRVVTPIVIRSKGHVMSVPLPIRQELPLNSQPEEHTHPLST